MTKNIRIVLADDHPIFRKGLVEVINTTPGMEVLAEASNGEELIRIVDETQPDIAVLDVNMPGTDGLQAATRILARNGTIKLLMLTMRTDEDVFMEAMDIGVNGYILKENAVSDVINGINAIMNGQTYLSPSISGLLVKKNHKPLEKKNDFLQHLTSTELRIFKLIAESKTSKEISKELFVSEKTIENHRTNICKKLKLKGKNSLLKFALEHRGW